MTYLDDLQVVKSSFAEMAKQTNGLALGLQNAAPPQKGLPPSVQYLFETTEQLQEMLKKIDELSQDPPP